jgi:hypothetical protein
MTPLQNITQVPWTIILVYKIIDFINGFNFMSKDTNFFQVLTPSSGFLDYAISMRPDYHQAIIDVVRYYGWRKIIYLYDSHDGKYTSVA